MNGGIATIYHNILSGGEIRYGHPDRKMYRIQIDVNDVLVLLDTTFVRRRVER